MYNTGIYYVISLQACGSGSDIWEIFCNVLFGRFTYSNVVLFSRLPKPINSWGTRVHIKVKAKVVPVTCTYFIKHHVMKT
jgi:hypothetical protein